LILLNAGAALRGGDLRFAVADHELGLTLGDYLKTKAPFM
jgi:hypothetical protein